MKKAYWIDGRLWPSETYRTSAPAQLEGFSRIGAITPEMRDVIETEWPDLAPTSRAAKRNPEPSCGVWKADGAKALLKLHVLAAAVTRDGLWTRLYVRGHSPEKAGEAIGLRQGARVVERSRE